MVFHANIKLILRYKGYCKIVLCSGTKFQPLMLLIYIVKIVLISTILLLIFYG